VQEYLTKMVGLEWSGSYYPLVIKRGQWTIHHVDMSVPLEPPFIYNFDKTIRNHPPVISIFIAAIKPVMGGCPMALWHCFTHSGSPMAIDDMESMAHPPV